MSFNSKTEIGASSSPLHMDVSASKRAMIDYLAGVAGGVAVVLVGHPFDTTKTRMQTAPNGYYKGVFDCVRQTVKYEGTKGFFSGITSPLLGQMFFRAASFMTFYQTVRTLSTCDGHGENNMQTLLLAGGMTGFAISFIETPIDLVKTKLQIQIFSTKLHTGTVPAYTTFRGCVQHQVAKHGLKSLYQGWSATAIRNVPANALFFPINEIIKQQFAKMDNVTVSEVSIKKKLISGGIAGLCYWTLTYPLDAIKGRCMGITYATRKSWFQVVKSMKFNEFFIGIGPCSSRGFLACSAMFFTVDVVRNYLQERL